MRRANKYNSLHRRIGIEDERAFDWSVVGHVGVKLVSFWSEHLVPDYPSGVVHLHARQDTAHAGTNEDGLLEAVSLLRISEVITQQERRVGNRVARRV